MCNLPVVLLVPVYLPLAARTGTAAGVLGIISNFKSVLLSVGGHLVAT